MSCRSRRLVVAMIAALSSRSFTHEPCATGTLRAAGLKPGAAQFRARWRRRCRPPTMPGSRPWFCLPPDGAALDIPQPRAQIPFRSSPASRLCWRSMVSVTTCRLPRRSRCRASRHPAGDRMAPDGDRVVADGQELRHVHRKRLGPLLARANGLAVDEDLQFVVTRRGELGLLRGGGQRDRLAKKDDVVVFHLALPPNPLGSGRLVVSCLLLGCRDPAPPLASAAVV